VHPDTRLQHTPHKDVVEISRRHVRPLERLTDDDGAEIGGRKILERAPERSDRRPARAHEYRIDIFSQRFLPALQRSVSRRLPPARVPRWCPTPPLAISAPPE